MNALAEEVIAAAAVRESSGAYPGGPDVNEWDARWYDAVKLARIEERRVDAAIEKYGDGLM